MCGSHRPGLRRHLRTAGRDHSLRELLRGGDLNWNRLVPGTIRSAVRGERPVIRSDGKSIRDYLYVEDGVSAYLVVAEALAARRELAGEAFNFGHNRGVTVLDMVRQILTVCRRLDLEPDVRADAAQEIPTSLSTPPRPVACWAGSRGSRWTKR